MSGKLFDIKDSSINGKLYSPYDRWMERKAKKAKATERKNSISKALGMGHKLCTQCNEEKSLKEFHVDKTTYTGYSSWCKSCKKDYNQRYRKNYSDNNVEGTDNDNTIG
jgi:hypothetical protein